MWFNRKNMLRANKAEKFLLPGGVCGEPLVIWKENKKKTFGVTFMFLFYVSLFAQQISLLFSTVLRAVKGWKSLAIRLNSISNDFNNFQQEFNK